MEVGGLVAPGERKKSGNLAHGNRKHAPNMVGLGEDVCEEND